MKSYNYLLIAIAFIFFLTIACRERRSADLNLDFEKPVNPNNTDLSWQFFSSQYHKASIDSKIAHKGNNSLKIENFAKPPQPIGGSAYLLLDSIQNGQNVRLSGYIKTENTNLDSIGLIICLIDSSETVYKVLNDVNLIGTHDWKEYTIELRNKKYPAKLAIGIALQGEGKIWADDLKLFIDGKQIYRLRPKSKFVASNQELKWLENNCTTIKTVQAESGFDDLEPLKQLIGDARIVGLGENTHGTSEVFKMKHRLVEFLSTKMNFTIFAIEANMPEAYKLNDYVLHGNGDPKSLLKGMYFWTWNTQEVLNMITWMRKFNVSGKGIVQFTGFDMQFYQVALDNISKFSEKHDKLLKSKIDSISGLFKKLNYNGIRAIENRDELAILKNKCEKVLLYLTASHANFSKIIGYSDYKWLIQNANIMVQCAELGQRSGGSYSFRDECMAKNITWILDNNPNSKIILWAHNEHIAKQKGSMGRNLLEKYGDKYYNIGFLSNSGTYTAGNSSRLSSKNILLEGKPGSFEYSFHKTGIPSFFFDFSQVKENEPTSKWLTYVLKNRSIGALATDYQFSESKISNLFNSIIYIDSTHASDCFGVTY
jgi:erythromycin esterase